MVLMCHACTAAVTHDLVPSRNVFQVDMAVSQDALDEIARQRPKDLFKPLRVHFIGEEGIDAGGVKKEFFQLLVAELLCPDYGMLIQNPVRIEPSYRLSKCQACILMLQSACFACAGPAVDMLACSLQTFGRTLAHDEATPGLCHCQHSSMSAATAHSASLGICAPTSHGWMSCTCRRHGRTGSIPVRWRRRPSSCWWA